MKIKARLHILVLATGLGASGPGLAGYFDSDCHALKLKDASGVPTSKQRTYSFTGTCNLNYVYSSGPSVLRTVPAVAQGKWDAYKFEFSETFSLLVDVQLPGVQDGNTHINGWPVGTGVVESVFKCNDDPMVTNASCGATFHRNESGFDPFSNPAKKQHRPLLKGKTKLAEATDFSKKHVNVGTVTPAQWPEEKKPIPTVKAGSGTPVNVAVPPGQLSVPPNPVRGSGGFVPGSGQRSAAMVAGDDARKTPATPGAKAGTIKGESRTNSQVPAVQQGLTSKGGGKVHSQVPAVQVSPGPPGSSAKARENLRGNLTNSPAEKSAPSDKQGLTATPKAAGQ